LVCLDVLALQAYYVDRVHTTRSIIYHSGAANSDFWQLSSKGTAIHGCTKSELTGASLWFGILLFVSMQNILANLRTQLWSVLSPTGGVQSETPSAFLHRMTNGTLLETKPLRFAYSRLSSLLRTLQISNLDNFNYLTDVANFATYSKGVTKLAILLEFVPPQELLLVQ
jgi:hypothetical protein